MKVYQLTFERSPRYRKRAYKELIKKGYPVELLPGIDAKELDGTIAELLVRNSVIVHECVKMTLSEVACYLAHLQAWKTFLESEDDYALILEDDTEPIVEYEDFLEEAKSWGCGWAFVQAEWSGEGSLHNPDFHPKMIRAHACGFGAMAYVISREGAHMLADTGVVKPPDLILMSVSCTAEAYRLKERLFKHDYDELSTVQDSPFTRDGYPQ